MNAVANDYSSGTLKGRGFETEFNGAPVHVIAWENGEVERLRNVPDFTSHLVISSVPESIPSLETELGMELQPSQGLPWNGAEQAIADAVKPFADSAEFYRGIVTQIGELLGPEAKTSDDGSVQLDVLALKVPELVKKLLEKPLVPEVKLPAEVQTPTEVQLPIAEATIE
jgi:hypothetical protein